ncbi:MAG TPA: BON domain-containing protein [Longimicrobiales bacterium]
MPSDREMEYGRARSGRGAKEQRIGRGEYGPVYEAPYRAGFHPYGMGYLGGSLRSRGSYEAGQLRSGLNPHDEFEFEWGGGYIGGRGYGGTNYDLEHGYRTGVAAPSGRGRTAEGEAPPATAGAPARVGTPWSRGAGRRTRGEPYGPARYGYGPYHERLRRRRRSDDELRKEVEEALFYDTWVDADRIQVTVDDGVVTLRGTLPSYDEVRYATDDAWDVDGVRGVRTELEVREPPQGARAAQGAAAPESTARASTAEAAAVPAGRARRTPRRPSASQPERTRAAEAEAAPEAPDAEMDGGTVEEADT